MIDAVLEPLHARFEVDLAPGRAHLLELPEVIEVDITELSLNDKIFVGDLTAPVGEFDTDPEMLVLNIKPAVVFVEEEETEEGEGEEGAEGEAAEGDGEKSEGDGEKSDD